MDNPSSNGIDSSLNSKKNLSPQPLLDATLIKIIGFALAGVFLYTILTQQFNLFFIPRAKITDQYVRLISHFQKIPPKAANKVVILGIDSESMKVLNQRWPWKRGTFSEVLKKLSLFSPKAVFFDLVFSGIGDPEDDLKLSEGLSTMKNIILASYINEYGQYVKPHPLFYKNVEGVGFINKPRDKDLFIRRTRAVVLTKDNNVLDYSAALKMVCLSWGKSASEIIFKSDPNKVILPGDAASLPVSLYDDKTFDIYYAYPSKSFSFIPIWKLIKGLVSDQEIRDKIILIGTTTEIVHDVYPTPLGVLPGIFINAYEFVTVANQEFIRNLSEPAEVCLLLIIVLAIAILSYRLSVSKGLIFLFLIVVNYELMALILYAQKIKADSFGPVFLGITMYVGTNFYKQIRLFVESGKLKQLALTDSLTKVYVRRYFQLRLEYECDRAIRYNQNFTLIMLDIDFFKKINDTYGHLCGDFVLRDIAQILQSASRKVDLICRYGGEEFVIILPQTDKEQTRICAEKIRTAIQNHQFDFKGTLVEVTASLGVASFEEVVFDNYESIIALADARLYQAKTQGRNKVIS